MNRLVRICRYPVKGLTPESLDEVALAPGRPLPGDRRYALAQGNAAFEGGRPHWIRRANFLQVASNAALVTLDSRFDPEGESLTIRRDGATVATGRLAEADGRRAIEDFFVGLLGDELRGRPRLVAIPPGEPGAEGQSFADTAPPHVSIINLATVADIGRSMGADLDPRRFRGNLYIEAPPWAEFGWIDRELRVGDARLRVTRRIGRCAATTVDPRTGERDQDVPRALLKQHGHADCGIYAVVTAGGTIRPGDEIAAAS